MPAPTANAPWHKRPSSDHSPGTHTRAHARAKAQGQRGKGSLYHHLFSSQTDKNTVSQRVGLKNWMGLIDRLAGSTNPFRAPRGGVNEIAARAPGYPTGRHAAIDTGGPRRQKSEGPRVPTSLRRCRPNFSMAFATIPRVDINRPTNSIEILAMSFGRDRSLSLRWASV